MSAPPTLHGCLDNASALTGDVRDTRRAAFVTNGLANSRWPLQRLELPPRRSRHD